MSSFAFRPLAVTALPSGGTMDGASSSMLSYRARPLKESANLVRLIYHRLLTHASLTLGVWLLLTMVFSSRVWFQQHYSLLTMPWTALYLLDRHLRFFGIPVLLCGILWLVAVFVLERRLGVRRAAAWTISGAVVASVGLWFLYNFNRNAPVNWAWKREWHGLRVPAWFWEREILLQNAGFVIAGIVITWAFYRLLRVLIPRLGRAWSALGHVKTLGLLAALVVLVSAGAHIKRRTASDRPNVLLVSLDTLRADHLSCYGYERRTSPVLDSLATHGYRFEWAISQAPGTLPSHMTLFTSLYPTVHGVWTERQRLPGRRLTLPEQLCESGYRTAAFTDGGFVRGSYGFSQGFEIYHDLWRNIRKSVPMALKWIDGIPASVPFFVFFHCYDIHDPYDPPPPYREMFMKGPHEGDFEPTTKQLNNIRVRLRENPGEHHGLTAEDVDYMLSLYDGGIRYTDHWMGRLLAGLRERGRLEDTWVIVLSDHGEEFTEHGSVLHERLFHTVTHVPLIISPPGGLAEPVVREEIVQLVDVAPTILDLCGVGRLAECQGESFHALLPGTGNESEWEDVAYSENEWFDREGAITTRDLHVIRAQETGATMGFVYPQDPLELSPVVDGPTFERVGQLSNVLDGWREYQLEQRGETPAEYQDLSPQGREQLRALGYLQ